MQMARFRAAMLWMSNLQMTMLLRIAMLRMTNLRKAMLLKSMVGMSILRMS